MELEDISAELRWEIVAKTAQSLFINYGLGFWTEGGREIKEIAESLGLPTKNIIDVSESWKIARSILMGKFEYRTLEKTEDHVVDCFKTCPMLTIHKENYTGTRTIPYLCQAHSKSAVNALNPKYTHRFTKMMCNGDDYCESIIEPKR